MAEIKVISSRKVGIFLKYDYNLKMIGNIDRTIKVTKSDLVVHEDLHNAFKQLIPHFAYICDEVIQDVDLDMVINDQSDLTESHALYAVLSNYSVKAIRVMNEGNADKEGVVISGTKTLKNGSILNIEAPLIKWTDKYYYMPDLQMAITAIQEETEEYHNGKCAPPAQKSLFDDPGGEDDQDGDDDNYQDPDAQADETFQDGPDTTHGGTRKAAGKKKK